jgi:adenine-specific DNA-methyltransferase
MLDAGAGNGTLSAAVVQRLCAERGRAEKVSVTAYEIDPEMLRPLERTYQRCKAQCERVGIEFSARILNEDFIESAAAMARGDMFSPPRTPFNAAILNPPYRKINSDSMARLLLRSAGIETSNLYTAFLALAVKLLSDGGELVAITPRSFCNGPYFRPFRELFLHEMALRRVHVFESRSAAFRRDEVLQENIIVHAVKSGEKPRAVIVSSSSGEEGGGLSQRECAYNEVVSPRDPEMFVHLATDEMQVDVRQRMARFTTPLPKLGLEVSTGRVVDFRAAEFLRAEPGTGTVPLIYPCHLNGGFVQWPKSNARKPNAILDVQRAQELLVPEGIYVLVKRFTSKEERRRIVACIYDPARIRAERVGFENHLNYFHAKGSGLPMALAKGLAAFLNSTLVDVFFRQFNGHTQVNATDLRSLKYPTRAELETLGRRFDGPSPEQAVLDELMQREFF